jgi:hypothetical protein
VVNLADVLHRIISLIPWREEAEKLLAHEVVSTELGGTGGAHEAPAEPDVVAPSKRDDSPDGPAVDVAAEPVKNGKTA